VGFELNAAILMGSLIASHTLLGFPILQKRGIAGREPLLVTISATRTSSRTMPSMLPAHR